MRENGPEQRNVGEGRSAEWRKTRHLAADECAAEIRCETKSQRPYRNAAADLIGAAAKAQERVHGGQQSAGSSSRGETDAADRR